MRAFLLTLGVAAGLLAASSAQAQCRPGAGPKPSATASLADADVLRCTREFVAWSDDNNPVAPADSPQARRLARITAELAACQGLALNYKVYLVRDVTAFACADGSVRVCAGLLDSMTDPEVLAVIGHEIGHVKNHDALAAMRAALLAAAAQPQGAAQFGAVGQALASTRFTRLQESAADDFGYALLKAQRVNPYYLASAFDQLIAEEEGGTAAHSTRLQQLFAQHPDTAQRKAAVERKAAHDGFEPLVASN